MHYKITSIVSLLFLSFTLWGCLSKGPGEPTDFILIDKEKVKVEVEAHQKETPIEFRTNRDWNVTIAGIPDTLPSDWLWLEPKEGTVNGDSERGTLVTVQLHTQENNSFADDRKAIVRVFAGALVRNINITQKRIVAFDIDDKLTELMVDKKGGSFTIPFISRVEWIGEFTSELNNTDPWITFTPKEGTPSDESTITFQIAENPVADDRSVTLRIKQKPLSTSEIEEGVYTKTDQTLEIYIHQEAGEGKEEPEEPENPEKPKEPENPETPDNPKESDNNQGSESNETEPHEGDEKPIE